MAQWPRRSRSRRRDLTLRQRAALLGLVFLLIVIALVVAAQATLADRASAATEIQEQIEPARLQAREALEGMAVGAGEERVLAPLDRLAELVADHPRLADGARSLQRTAAVGFSSSEERAVLLEQLEAFHLQLQQEQARAQAQLLEAESRLVWVLWTVLGVGSGLAAAAAWFFQRWVSTPLGKIAEAADRVREGDLHLAIPVVGAPELRGLAGNVERMRARIVGLLDTSRRATEALGQQGVAVVRLGAELEPSGQRLPAGVRFAAAHEPAEGVLAGDWYDCVDLGDGRVALAVVDVSGHGPEAGIFALRVKNLLRAALGDGQAPGAALGWLATHIGDTGERFLTAFVADVDTATGWCRWASAGHPPAAILTDGAVEHLRVTGPLLGPLPGEWETDETSLGGGATLVAYTDGLIEARRGAEQFGYERLCHMAKVADSQEPAAVVDVCVRAVRDFAGGRAEDDITVVALSLAGSIGDQNVPAPAHSPRELVESDGARARPQPS